MSWLKRNTFWMSLGSDVSDGFAEPCCIASGLLPNPWISSSDILVTFISMGSSLTGFNGTAASLSFSVIVSYKRWSCIFNLFPSSCASSFLSAVSLTGNPPTSESVISSLTFTSVLGKCWWQRMWSFKLKWRDEVKGQRSQWKVSPLSWCWWTWWLTKLFVKGTREHDKNFRCKPVPSPLPN